ncbi:MAG: prephenate dehydrogenase [Cyclobacteriaceae bacterium]|jgi:prephenate dehydrogenase|nr:prephenate dehydrogenase [Cytophagales bacterium]HNP77716.1 prephenate dehydrogenase [Cyclobacteriaceae bacterium]
MKITIVGLGLIGGSMAIDLRKAGIASRLVGVDRSEEHGQRALELGLVDVVEPEDRALADADVVILAIPVNILGALLPQVMDVVKKDTVVIDTGSTKSLICKSINNHPNRQQFVAAHPIAGTENSGPDAAFSGLFNGMTNIICERDKSSEHALSTAIRIFDALGLKTIYMEAEEHDRHVAYVSHLSHVSSFLLGQTVLDIEKDEKNIFNLAGSGLASTVRLAKSSPDMWAPIFEQNAEYLGQALAEYIMHLQKFHYQLMKRNTKELYRVMKEANKIRKVLDGMGAANRPAPGPAITHTPS